MSDFLRNITPFMYFVSKRLLKPNFQYFERVGSSQVDIVHLDT